MFKYLTYDVTFSTGRKLEQDFNFENGLTAIFGANGCGKSVSLEMIRFCLFGSGALRGKTSEYESINARLRWQAKGCEFNVFRTMRSAELTRDGEVIATGKTAVDAKIVEQLGFSLAVFDVACAANQGDIERLSSMAPTERKRLIDSVIGIGALEQVGKWAGDESALRRREAEGIRSALTEPTKPVAPETYWPSNQIADDIERLGKVVNEMNMIKAFLSQGRPLPSKPVAEVDTPASELQVLAEKNAAVRMRVEQLRTRLRVLPDSAKSEHELIAAQEALDAVRAYDVTKAWLKMNPKPDHCETKLRMWEADWEQIWINNQHKTCAHSLERAKEGTHVCSSCGHLDYLDQDRVTELEAALAALPLFREVATPPIPVSKISLLLAQWKAFTPNIEEWAWRSTEAQPAAPPLSAAQLEIERRRAKNFAERPALEAELLEAEKELLPIDIDGILARRRAYEASLASYDAAMDAYGAWQADCVAKEARLLELADAPAALADAQHRHTAARVYEAQLTIYEAALETYQRGDERAKDIEFAAEQFRRIKAAITTLRLSVKQHLLPSLNMVASKLLQDMTGGQKTSIYIDDDFDITVDRQSINTMSGSEKACVNLAIRLGLAQVLTNNTLSVFLADEIDASMDSFRAGKTSETLRALQARIKQIILVSHKETEADHVFNLTP